MITIHRVPGWLLLALTLFISGCEPCRNCGIPRHAIQEMQQYGMAITTQTYPFPASINVSVFSDAEYTLGATTEYVTSDDIALVFSPPVDKAFSNFPSGNEWDEHPYAYVFSVFVDNEYRLIKPLLPHNYSVAPTTDLTSQFAPIRVDDFPPELVLYGNHILTANAAFPKQATHIELWHRQQREDDLTLVKRIELENFFAWREYFRPAFGSIQ